MERLSAIIVAVSELKYSQSRIDTENLVIKLHSANDRVKLMAPPQPQAHALSTEQILAFLSLTLRVMDTQVFWQSRGKFLLSN